MSKLLYNILYLLICNNISLKLWVSSFLSCYCLFKSLNVWVLIAISYSVKELWNWSSSQYLISVSQKLLSDNTDSSSYKSCYKHIIVTKLCLIYCCYSEDWQWMLLHFLIKSQELFLWVLLFFYYSHSHRWQFLWEIHYC